MKIPEEKIRILDIIKAIPNDVSTILDVGCGNGAFVNALLEIMPDRFSKVVGLDFNKRSLNYVKTQKIQGTISVLPFRDNNFELVSCLEVLEHVPYKDYHQGISELQRVSSRYILITVPNDQDLERYLVTCPICNCWFNPNFHLRSFNKDKLESLFDTFLLIKFQGIGPIDNYRYCKYRLLNSFYRVWKKRVPPSTAICPQCGYQNIRKDNHFINQRSNSYVNILLLERFIKSFISINKKRRWLLALYENADG